MKKANMRKILNQKKSVKNKYEENPEPKEEYEQKTKYHKNPDHKKKIVKRCIERTKNV